MNRSSRRNKYWLFGCILLSFFFLSGCGTENGSQTEVEISAANLSDAMDVCADKNTYYVAAADKILLFDDKGKPGEVYAFPERIVAQVAYGDTLYALDMQNQSILKVNQKGNIEDEYALEFSIDGLVDFEAIDTHIYLSVGVQEEDAYTERTYVLHWKEQEMKELLGKGVPMAENGSLLTYQNGELIGYETTAESETDGEPYGTLGTGFAHPLTSFCIDSNHRYFYCMDQKVIKEEKGQTEYLHDLDTDYDAVATCGDTVMLLKRFERLTVVTKKAEKKEFEKSISLYGTGTEFDMPDGTHRNLKKEFEEQQGATVDRTSGIGMNQETFLTNLMSGSDKYDIYSINGMLENAAYYVKNHAYVDLSQDAEIVKKMGKWYPSVLEGCYYNGELFAVPSGCSVELLYYNTNNYPELAEEDLSSWDVFLDVIEKYDKPVQFNKIRLESVLLEQYVATYCEPAQGQYEFDTEAFRKVLGLLRRIEAMNIRYDEKKGSAELFENGEVFAFHSQEPYVESGAVFLPLPSINGEVPVCPVELGYNMINPNSSQQELAMEYVSLLAECGSYTLKDSAGKYPLLADVFENHAKCIFGNCADYSGALEKYVSGIMTEEETIRQIEEQTQRKLNQ